MYTPHELLFEQIWEKHSRFKNLPKDFEKKLRASVVDAMQEAWELSAKAEKARIIENFADYVEGKPVNSYPCPQA